jgi:hypothetical protein
LSFYNGFNPYEPFSFRIFGKSFFNQILVEQGKKQLLLETLPFFLEKIPQKSGIRSGFLKYFILQSNYSRL